MTRDSHGRVAVNGDGSIEDIASALVLASRMTGAPATDQDITDVLIAEGHPADAAGVAAVRALLP